MRFRLRRILRPLSRPLPLILAFSSGIVACGDSATTQPTRLDPGERFEEVYPGQVSDLGVRALNHQAMELAWTEVDDGKGSPAQYQIRMVEGSGGSWETASVVREGSCGYPVRGAAPGATVRCILLGLRADRNYTFLVAAERAELTGLVPGTPSRGATARTRPEPLIDVPAHVELESGSDQTGRVGEALQTELRLVLRDSLGNPMPNVQVVWTTVAGGGRPAAPASWSNPAGIARTVWTLGPQAGPQSLAVRIPGREDLIVTADARPGPVDQLRFAVDTVSLGVGEETRLAVTGWDEYGNAIEDLELEWTSSNPSVVSVGQGGTITTAGRGWGRIRTSTRDRGRGNKTQDSTTVVVEADPSNLGDLTVDGAGETWLGLSFTEVDDGTGTPASYHVRVGTPGASWEAATEVAEGSCASPMAGTAIGAARTCNVGGLTEGTAYDVLVRPFRMKGETVVSAASAARAGGTTLEAPEAVGGVVAESGTNQVGVAGQALPAPVVVRVLDTSGDPLPGTAVAFHAPDGGQVSPAAGTTDGSGRASVVWTLGPQAGVQRLLIALGDQGGGSSLVEPVSVPATAVAGPATTLQVDPSALALDAGQTASFTVRALDAFGNPTSASGASWGSDAPSVVTVDGAGRVTAVGGGRATIEVVVGSASAQALVDVTAPEPPAIPDPDRIDDLRVVSTTQDAVVLEYTEVDDGTGNAAVAEIRYAYSPIGWGWGEATKVTSGTCASPIAGGAVGAVRRCVVDGLQDGTVYDFQMVAWRMEDGEAVFSPLSSVATGTTESSSAPPPPSVSRVEVAPSPHGFDKIGLDQQMVGVAYDAAGNVVATPLSWSSSNPSVASISSSGLLVARGEGTTVITAKADCCAVSGTGEVWVRVSSSQPPPPAVSRIELSPSSGAFDTVGQTRQFTATAYDASDRVVSTTLSWRSSNTSVATVSSSGLVTARASGSATITATADCCSVSGTAQVSVTLPSPPPPASVSRIDVTPGTVGFDGVGQTRQFTATGRDASGNVVSTNISWRSSNTSVATVSSSGLVTARASGSATITATADCCNVSGTAQVSVTLPPPPPPSSGDAWFEIDFDRYGSVAEIEAIPGVTLTGIQEHTLTTGLSGTGWGGRNALRLNFPVSRSAVDMGLGLEIMPPDRGSVRAREVWIEVWTRVGPTWTTEGKEKPADRESYTGSHKFLLMYDNSHDSWYRWEDMQGVFATQGEHQVMIAGGTKGIGRAGHTFEYDGQWHRYRYHARMDEVNGRFMLDMDGAKQIGFDGAQDTSQSPDHYFDEIQFGANNNRGTDGVNDMWYEIAGIKIYRTNPGWSF